MESWNHIINTALLGTDKRPLRKEDLAADITTVMDEEAQQTGNREEVFLQTAALVYNYRQCGFVPLQKQGISLPVADPEVKAYANIAAHQALHDILELESVPLLVHWLQQCAAAQKIVQPEAIPVLLDGGMRYKQLRELAYTCSGKRGAWLVAFNENWKYTVADSDEELWQTGTLDERKNLLAEIRAADASRGRLLLQQVWTSENAAARTELVKQLSIGLCEEDLPWLEEQLQEKSSKVKEEVMVLLKRLPSSSIVQRYWRLLEPSVEVRKEKALLGLSSKTVLDIFPVKQMDDTVFKTGIEKMSSEKNVSDHEFLLYQLIMAVPPSFFETYTGLEKTELLNALQHTQQGKNFLPAFATGAIQFKEVEWLRVILRQDKLRFYADALSLLPQAEAEAYALQHSDKEDQMPVIIDQLTKEDKEWGMAITKAVFTYTAKYPYQYPRSFYNGIVQLIPVAIAGELESLAPQEEYTKTMWNNLSAYIIKLLTLKSATRKAFNE